MSMLINLANLEGVEEEAIEIAKAIKAERDKIQDELSKLNTGYVGAEGGRIESSMQGCKSKA
ncbi:MAG: hypothetical protein CM15mV49_600 [uncultured marine virus]|nr:MAG: hypothetical protein CM15mV49_600 [uncultured marine virus]